MKKAIPVLLCTILSAITPLFAQQKFPLEWKSQFPVATEWRLINDDRSLLLGGDLNELAMVDGVTGKVMWAWNFKEKFGTKKAKDWGWYHDKQSVWIKFKGEEKGSEKMIYVDERSGEAISESEYSIRKDKTTKSKRGNSKVRMKQLKTAIDVPGFNAFVSLEYEKKAATASYNTKKKTPVTVTCSGGFNWTVNVDVILVRNLCSGFAGSSETMFGGDYLDLVAYGDKIFVMHQGIVVLDLKTGRQLWEASFDNSDLNFQLMRVRQTIGRAALPLVEGNGVYVADLSKKQYCIKKYNLENGTLLWESPKFDDDDVVPELQLGGNVLLVRFGGSIERQTYVPGTEGRPDVCKTEFTWIGDAGVRAYDAGSGKLLWETWALKELGDKFKGSISNMVVENNTVYVASERNVYALDVATGKAKFAAPVSKMKIGDPKMIATVDNDLLVQSEEGLARLHKTDGSVVYATNTDKCLGIFFEGDAFFVWTGKSPEEWSQFVRFDLDNGNMLGKISDTRYPKFTPDGEAFIKFDGNKIFRYKTR